MSEAELKLLTQQAVEDYPNMSQAHEVYMYMLFGSPCGYFLQAVMKNDLMESFGRADRVNRDLMFDITSWLCRCPFRQALGSPEAYNEWIKIGGAIGMYRSSNEEQPDDKTEMPGVQSK